MILIGEKINASAKSVREAIARRDRVLLQELARRQEQAGVDYLDVNAATGKGDPAKEAGDLAWAVQVVQEAVSKPLALDTANPQALAAACKVARGKPLINSLTLEKDRFEPFLELALEYSCDIIALPISDRGLPTTAAARLEVCREIKERVAARGFRGAIFFDPLVLPVAVDDRNGLTTLQTLKEIKEKLGGKTLLGLGNISFGLPCRELLDSSFLLLALGIGVDAVIVDPLKPGLRSTLTAARLLLGQDAMCVQYLRAYRSGELSRGKEKKGNDT